MRVFVYEYLTATGIGREVRAPEHGLYREGRAMRDAVASDFARVPGVEVVTLDRVVSGDPEHEIRRAAEKCDWALVIAPETDGQMDRDCRAVRASGCRLLGSTPDAIRATTDKLALAERWHNHGVRTPATTEREPTACDAFPVVWKPRDGAGSVDTFLIRDRFELAQAKAIRDPARPMILQEYVPGQPASVAFLCGASKRYPLRPAFQLLSADARFKYRGGELPIPTAQAERATQLAQSALARVPGLLGYVGVDLVLGDATDGSRDYAIEINPRLTTSYIGLRTLADFNLAEAMLRVAQGELVAEFQWKPGRVRFGPDGTVSVLD